MRPLIGVNYFAGWWRALPNKWHRRTAGSDLHDWRGDYPDRVPVLGEFNEQATMDREIVAASEHGVDFFPILWYYCDPERKLEPNAQFLARGVETFMASPEAGRMSFFLEFCNHPPFEVQTDAQWESCIETWLPMLAHPSYMRVDGRLVFKVHGAGHFLNQNNGDEDLSRRRLERLRSAVRDAGLGEMVISGDSVFTRLFDFTCTYMDVPSLPVIEEQDYPFEQLAGLHRAARYVHTHDALPYVPYLAAGWCPRPWGDPRPAFELPNRLQWRSELLSARDDLAVFPNLGIPRVDGSLQPALTVYAWNEFGEGGIVAPTRGEGRAKLEEIRNAFGTTSTHD
jgi:hypothetical protein